MCSKRNFKSLACIAVYHKCLLPSIFIPSKYGSTFFAVFLLLIVYCIKYSPLIINRNYQSFTFVLYASPHHCFESSYPLSAASALWICIWSSPSPPPVKITWRGFRELLYTCINTKKKKKNGTEIFTSIKLLSFQRFICLLNSLIIIISQMTTNHTFFSCAKKHKAGPIVWLTPIRSPIKTKSITDRVFSAECI